MKTHMGSGLRPITIMSSTSMRRSQLARFLKHRSPVSGRRSQPSASPAPAPGPSGDPGDSGGHLLQGRAAQTPASRGHGVNARFHFNRLPCCKFQ